MLIDEEHGQDLADSSYSTKGITQWYSQESPTSTNSRLIRPTFLGRKAKSWTSPRRLFGLDQQYLSEAFSNELIELLLTRGWTREEYNPSLCPMPASAPYVPIMRQYIYNHPSLPRRQFWRPFTLNYDQAF